MHSLLIHFDPGWTCLQCLTTNPNGFSNPARTRFQHLGFFSFPCLDQMHQDTFKRMIWMISVFIITASYVLARKLVWKIWSTFRVWFGLYSRKAVQSEQDSNRKICVWKLQRCDSEIIGFGWIWLWFGLALCQREDTNREYQQGIPLGNANREYQ